MDFSGVKGFMEKFNDFDIKAFRGHFDIASSHFENGVKNFEILQKNYEQLKFTNSNLESEYSKFTSIEHRKKFAQFFTPFPILP